MSTSHQHHQQVMTIATENWTTIAQAKQQRNLEQIPAEWRIKPVESVHVMDVPASCGILDATELKITDTSAPELVAQMKTGSLKSHDVVTAFAKRTAIAHQLTNCLSEINFTSALAQASALDKSLAETGKVVGPLHGLPISLKDNFNVEGLDTTLGFVAWANDPFTAETESELVKSLKSLGAIILGKTNVPTAMMMPETYNNVFGYTTNPYNTRLSSGGSSGGESSLLALRGTPLGVGSDIGGSVRIPASFTGLYALKPSFGRFSTYGARSGLPGQEAVRSINGPMSADIKSLELFAKAIVDSEGWLSDPNIVPIPWRNINLPEKLCFGILVDDGIVKPLPPVQRAMERTRRAIEAAGHTVLDYTPYKTEQSIDIIARLFRGDGGAKIASVIAESGEPWPQGLAAYQKTYEATKSTPPTVDKLWDTQIERLVFVKKTLEHWQATASHTGTGRPIDGLLSPTTPWAASPKHGFEFHIPYTGTWNLTDQSATTFPAGFSTLEDVNADGYVGRNEIEKKIWARYDPEESVGAPVGLQIVGLRLEEEKVLKLTEVAMKALEAL